MAYFAVPPFFGKFVGQLQGEAGGNQAVGQHSVFRAVKLSWIALCWYQYYTELIDIPCIIYLSPGQVLWEIYCNNNLLSHVIIIIVCSYYTK